MKKYILIFILIPVISIAQSARIKGIILDENQQAVADVSIKYNQKGTTTNKNGFYIMQIPANEKVTLVFSHVTLKSVTLTLNLKPNEDFEYNLVMKDNISQIGEVIIDIRKNKRVEGITSIEPEEIRKIPGANAGVENILKTLPGVNSNSDLSTSYSVRGGNYDENLVYVNDIEIYRPFLIRSGQQEGLSFTNTDMVQNVDFSAGGFQAKYGDKLSSVLDITYRRPRKFAAALEASFLGGSLTVDAVSKNQKWTFLNGVRYRDNSLLVNSQETETNFRPTFADYQTYTTYTPNQKWAFGFLGNVAINNYNYQPLARQTNFGTASEPIALLVLYNGQEKDKYQTLFGAFKASYQHNENNTYKFISSIYHTQEQEYFDIEAQYRLGEIDSSIGSETLGGVVYSRGIGSQINHARNNLDALIVNAEIKGNHNIKSNILDWGIKYTKESIRDRLVEWEVIDSAGFSINPLPVNFIRDQPYNPYTGPLVPYQNVRKTNFTDINRISGFAQWSKKSIWNNHELSYNIGIRTHFWTVSGKDISNNSQIVISPRAQFSIKPNWKKDMVFRLSSGLYHQPPFYRELRGYDGNINENVKAQQSFHVVTSADYSFNMWKRPFKLVAEAYYKAISDVNTYAIDNVRIRYRANNEANAYAYGFDTRINGEFVEGVESWFTFGYMKTQENQNNRGYIDRPTDQRLKFAVLFQDYIPKLPSFKMYLNMVYNTGLPGGSPAYADPYDYQLRLKDYIRADAGFSYVLTENNKNRPNNHWLKKFKDLSIGFEIFNLFNNQNAITNTWVRDVYTKSQYGVPNYMTTRVFNLKLTARL
jgi:hypothetical protein